MQRLQAYKFELMPNGEQVRFMRSFAGSCRFVFNKTLAWQQSLMKDGQKRPRYAALTSALTEWKSQHDTSWLSESPSQALQQALKNLEAGWERHFASLVKLKKGLIKPSEVVEPPVFKKKGRSRASFRFPQGITLDQANGRIKLPKLGWMRYRKSRDVEGTVKNVTVSACDGKWFISVQTEREVEQPMPFGGMVGIDVGIARFATLSDGSFFESINSFKRHEDRLRKAQQAQSRKVKFSNNWKKAKAKVNRIHTRIANVRRDFLHKATTTISKNHAICVIEDLQVKNMSKSASGSTEKPGKKVKQKSGLNKAILDQGWGEFRRQLDYKLAWNGGHLLAVPAQNTSRTCPECGHIAKDNRKTQARFACVSCGYENNADHVGALNILRAGHARLACEVSGEVVPPAAGTHRSELAA